MLSPSGSAGVGAGASQGGGAALLPLQRHASSGVVDGLFLLGFSLLEVRGHGGA